MAKKPSLAEYFNLALLLITAVVLLALQYKLLGFILLVTGGVLLLTCRYEFRRNIALAYGCLALLGITPINTTINFSHGLAMGIPLIIVVLAPYLITKKIYKNHIISFPFGRGRHWKKRDIGYVLFTAAIGFLILPPMLRSGNSYMNWEILPGAYELAESYIGLNVVGIWDELFFVSTIFAIFRRHYPFWVANFSQAVFFTSFLYTLGFQGWSPLIIFPFALSQGYIFVKTHSLFYVLTIHLTLDLVLHLTLVYLHHPAWLPFFIT